MGKKKTAPVDASGLLKKIEQEERDAFEEFERKQKEKREKALADVIDPLRKRRGAAAQQVNELNSEISELDRQIARLTGREPRKARHGASGGKRFRPSAEEIAAEALRIGKHWKDQFGNKAVARKNVLAALDPRWHNHLPKLILSWNKNSTDHKIGTNGLNKAASRYVMK